MRYIQAAIKEEQILLTKVSKVSGSSSAEADYDKMVSELDAKTPTYLIFNQGKKVTVIKNYYFY